MLYPIELRVRCCRWAYGGGRKSRRASLLGLIERNARIDHEGRRQAVDYRQIQYGIQ